MGKECGYLLVEEYRQDWGGGQRSETYGNMLGLAR